MNVTVRLVSAGSIFSRLRSVPFLLDTFLSGSVSLRFQNSVSTVSFVSFGTSSDNALIYAIGLISIARFYTLISLGPRPRDLHNQGRPAIVSNLPQELHKMIDGKISWRRGSVLGLGDRSGELMAGELRVLTGLRSLLRFSSIVVVCYCTSVFLSIERLFNFLPYLSEVG